MRLKHEEFVKDEIIVAREYDNSNFPKYKNNSVQSLMDAKDDILISAISILLNIKFKLFNKKFLKIIQTTNILFTITTYNLFNPSIK